MGQLEIRMGRIFNRGSLKCQAFFGTGSLSAPTGLAVMLDMLSHIYIT